MATTTRYSTRSGTGPIQEVDIYSRPPKRVSSNRSKLLMTPDLPAQSEWKDTQNQRKLPEHLLPVNYTEWKTKRYKLNETSALQKKLSATLRDEQYFIEESGNGLNIACQAGLYELFRRAACQYYSNFHTAGLNVSSIVHTDSEHAVVQVTFKIATYGGQTAYVVDLYHTSSTLRVSGRSQQKFFDNDWPKLGEEIREMNNIMRFTEPTTLNDTMRTCLGELLVHLKNKAHRSSKQQKKAHQKELTELSEATGPQNQFAAGLIQDCPDRKLESEYVEEVANRLPPVTYAYRNQASTPTSSPKSHTLGINRQTPVRPTIIPCSLAAPHIQPSQQATEDVLVQPQQVDVTVVEPRKTPGQHTKGTMSLQNPGEKVAPPTTPCHSPDMRYRPPTCQADIGGRGEDIRSPIFHNTISATTARYEPQTCRSCHLLRVEWNTALLDIQHREKRVIQLEKNLKLREKEMEKALAQVETQRAVIAGLESRIKELTATNRLLQQVIDAGGPPSTPPTRQQHHQQDNPPSMRTEENLSKAHEEIRTLREELRYKELESRLTDRLMEMEHRLRTQFTPLPPTPVPVYPPWYPNPMPTNLMGHQHYPNGPYQQPHHNGYQRPTTNAHSWSNQNGIPKGPVRGGLNPNPGTCRNRPNEWHAGGPSGPSPAPQVEQTEARPPQTANCPKAGLPQESQRSGQHSEHTSSDRKE